MVSRSIIPAVVSFAALWWLLAEGAATSWLIGIPAVLLAAVVWSIAVPPTPLVWYELFRFLPFFFLRSVLGGFDVARRTFHPRKPLAPDLIRYPLRLPHEISHVMLINAISLLPGTLSAKIGEGYVTVHVLDREKNYTAEFAALERQIARLTGVRAPAPAIPDGD